ncbi:hypothetical protein KJ656_03870, partial [bacterium]|nr:hypothetical protein [bacterium]
MKKLILFLLISTMLLGQAWRNPDIVPYRRIFNLKTGAEITALGAPDVGWGFVYAKDDKQFYFMDSDSVEYLLSFALTSGIVDSLTLAAAGVKLTAADGVLTIIGLGNGNDENLTFDFDNAAANEVNVASGTGVTGIDFGTIDLKTDYVWAQTFDTDVAAAAVTLSAATLAADGTDANINIAITPKGTGEVDITKVDIDGGAIDGTVIGENSAEDAKFDTVKAVNYSGASDFEIGSAGEDIT